MILTKCSPNRKVKKERTYMGNSIVVVVVDPQLVVVSQAGLVCPHNLKLGISLQCS